MAILRDDVPYKSLDGFPFRSISKTHIIRTVSKKTGLKPKFVEMILDRDSDGVFYDFEVKDWVEYFDKKMYL